MKPPTSPLKMNKDSCYIKKSPSSSFLNQQQRHHPVIIYTHSPKIIHTNPYDFRALVQKLTGLSSHNSDPITNYHDNNNSCDARINSSSATIFYPPNTNQDTNNNDIGINSSSPCCIPQERAIFDVPHTIDENENEDTDLDFLYSASYEPLCNYTDSFFIK
ncbi:hypothetical protein MTR67_015566 [Solanum verrucosum]|uniref:VQ domain-containing protein n=1 Tax=Solanum verrucosum TaxID=315347 RepID=A0AAF0QK89_SOLVR|nr:hypothetical protein MTR67_015566 [Solanum verrucosum]